MKIIITLMFKWTAQTKKITKATAILDFITRIINRNNWQIKDLVIMSNNKKVFK